MPSLNTPSDFGGALGSPQSAKEKEKRVSRACVACRARKTRCDLDGDGKNATPPCRRCIKEGQECILATSRRGGARVRKSGVSKSLPRAQARSEPHVPDTDKDVEVTENADEHDRQQSLPSNGDIENRIASAEVLNPDDALNLLAQVADRDATREAAQHRHSNSVDGAIVDFPPVTDKYMTKADVLQLLDHYRRTYHPFFPLAYSKLFETDVAVLVATEAALLTAALIIATKDEPAWKKVHHACCSHMEILVSKLIYRGSNSVGAVEALLILAEWVPQRLQSSSSVGRGEEDHGAWMHVGIAIRLGYLQRLEQTGLIRNDKFTAIDERKRLAWAGCYMSDRQISIRLGKGFWSRGPGPATLLTATDFPSLKQKQGGDDLSLLIQANMELTQLFTNSHDILYSSTSHREHLYAGGEYVKYIDDFTSTLRKWKLVWGAVSFTGHVRATLNLSYDFLRLYINAFAFQANINRAVTKARQSSNSTSNQSLSNLFTNIAGLPDARFLYEAIDAANSLLSTINNYVDPESGLRYMPFKYYLYAIYAAVFLFKARTAGAIDAEASNSVRRAVTVAIERFKKSAVDADSLGHRYSRLLHLLWRKQPATVHDRATTPANVVNGTIDPMLSLDASVNIDFDPLNGFSWRDLDSVGQFVATGSDYSDSLLFADPGFNLTPAGNSGLEGVTEDVYDQLWMGNGTVF